MPVVYLLHFDRPVCATRPAQHLLGYAADIRKREAQHRAGGCCAVGLTRAAYERGINFTVVRLWSNATKRLEYQLRALHNNPKLCPIRNPALQLKCVATATGYRMLRNGTFDRYGDPNTLAAYTPRKPSPRIRADGSTSLPDADRDLPY